jgi:hypothetical protein
MAGSRLVGNLHAMHWAGVADDPVSTALFMARAHPILSSIRPMHRRPMFEYVRFWSLMLG